MHPILKRSLHLGGSILAISGIIFVALRLYEYSSEISFARFDILMWLVVTALTLIYGLSNLMLASAWWCLLKKFGVAVSHRWAVRVYGISQISKYVPGNIFHLAGRQAIGMSAGVAGWPLAKSAMWELGLISVTGSLFGFLTLSLLVPGLPVYVSVGVFAAVIGIAAILIWRLFGLKAMHAFGWYVGFLLISGFLFVVLIEMLLENHWAGIGFWFLLGGAYVLAWLVGLVTPGAPAGVGVRELILFFLLKGVIVEADLLLAVVLGRMITVGGDSLYYFVSLFMKDKNVVI